MDNYSFPIVQLNKTESEEDEEIFNVCRGDGRWALFHMMGDWLPRAAALLSQRVIPSLALPRIDGFGLDRR